MPKTTSEKRYQVIANKIKEAIKNKQLRFDDRLPSLRKMSHIYEVSVGTILNAYLQLEKEKFIQSKPQSGFYVSYKPRLRGIQDSRKITPVNVEISDLVAMIMQTSQGKNFVNLGASSIPENLFPLKTLNKIVQKLIKDYPEHSGSYLYPPGLKALRIQIAKHCAYFGKLVKPENIVITSGAIDAINLCLRSVAEPGDAVIVESPSYYGFLQLIEYLGMKAIEIPADPKTGINLEILSKVLKKQKAKACVITANFSNPMRSLMPEQNKKLLVEMMSHYGISIIEDDVFGALHFSDSPPKPLFAYDQGGIVQYCSSFSKTLSPGFRLGWAIPGKCQAGVEKLKYMTSMATSSFSQHLVAQYLQNGGYERHLRKLRKAIQNNMTAMLQAIYTYFPSNTEVILPDGGGLLWVKLPEFVDMDLLTQQAIQHKISIVSGKLFSTTANFNNYLRFTAWINFDSKVEASLKILGQLMKN